jgi:hypothetical protein
MDQIVDIGWVEDTACDDPAQDRVYRQDVLVGG